MLGASGLLDGPLSWLGPTLRIGEPPCPLPRPASGKLDSFPPLQPAPQREGGTSRTAAGSVGRTSPTVGTTWGNRRAQEEGRAMIPDSSGTSSWHRPPSGSTG